MPEPKLVLVTWHDAHSLSNGWISLDDKEIGESIAVVQTAGWMIHKDKDYIVIAGTLSDPVASQAMKIPRVNIKKTQTLYTKTRKRV